MLWACGFSPEGVSQLRVLYLLNFAGKAGTERYVETLVRALGNDGRVEPFFAYHIEGLLVERMRQMGVPSRRLEMKSRFDRKAARALADLCKEWDIDVIHTQYLRENYIAMRSKRWNPDVKVVYTSHFIQANNWHTRLSNRVMDRRQDGVIAVCTAGKAQLIQNGLDGENIVVVFNGVDPALWAGGKAQPSALRRELDVPEGTQVMLCASRFAEDKGHAFLIEGIRLLKDRTAQPFHLALAGDGPLVDEVKEQVRREGLEHLVTFLGFREDIGDLLHGSDIYVNASRHEALSFLIIEALACGLPVVVTNMGGNGDIVNEETGCGLLVEYNNPADLALALKRMLEHPEEREAFHKGALHAAGTRFHIDKMVGDTYQLYETVLQTGRLGGRRPGGLVQGEKQAGKGE
jgi:glycosyltransferase involved in cell wall biosynthesis